MAQTQLNADSSRSHTVFTINVYARDAAAAGGSATAAAASVVNRTTGQPAEGCRLWSRISVVDLAGSERARRTGIEGERLREAAAINQSLMVLMKCLDIMRENAGVGDCARAVCPHQPPRSLLFAFTNYIMYRSLLPGVCSFPSVRAS
jgi:hypothetical protein